MAQATNSDIANGIVKNQTSTPTKRPSAWVMQMLKNHHSKIATMYDKVKDEQKKERQECSYTDLREEYMIYGFFPSLG